MYPKMLWITKRILTGCCLFTLLYVVENSFRSSQHMHALTQEAVNKKYELQESLAKEGFVSHLEWEVEQMNRRELVRTTCGTTASGLTRMEKYSRLIKNREGLGHMLVDKRHKALYCYIPKTGSTNWKRIWMVLAGIASISAANNFDRETLHTRARKLKLVQHKVKDDVIAEKLQNYTKVIMVRHPMERLISAYLDKIHRDGEQLSFRKQILPFIKSTRKSANLTNITWQEFISYIISPDVKADEHWLPYRSLCHPCDVDYDVIVKFETLSEDAERLLRLIEAPEDIHFPRQDKRVNPLLVTSYVKNLTKDQLHGLCEHFGQDFDMFGYDRKEVCLT